MKTNLKLMKSVGSAISIVSTSYFCVKLGNNVKHGKF